MAGKTSRVTLPSAPATVTPRPAPAEGADFDVAIKIRNGRLLRSIRDAGYASVAAFARAHGFVYSDVQKFVSMTQSPFSPSGKPSNSAQQVADILKTNVEDLFPPQFIGKCLAKTARAEVPSLTEDQVAMLIQNVPRTPEELAMLGDAGQAIERALKSLPPRVEQILRLRFALGNEGRERTLEEVAGLYNVTRERVRQIELKGLRLLKAPSRSSGLAAVAEPLGVFIRRKNTPPPAVSSEREPQPKETVAQRDQGEFGQKLKRRVLFPDERPTRRMSVPDNVIRDRTNAPPPGRGVLIGTPGVDDWVDLRGQLVPDEVSAAVVFHKQLVIGWTDGRVTPLPPGSYIVPRWALKNVPSELVWVRYTSE
jgi:RNA polymerase sigma factor (sigma-70 family)